MKYAIPKVEDVSVGTQCRVKIPTVEDPFNMISLNGWFRALIVADEPEFQFIPRTVAVKISDVPKLIEEERLAILINDEEGI